MKSLQECINEKLVIGKNSKMADVILDIDAITDKIIANFDIKKPGSMTRSKNNGVVSRSDYIYLSDAISDYLNKHNIKNVCENDIMFFAEQRCIDFLPEKLKQSYLVRKDTSWPTVDINRLYICYFTDGPRRGDTKFSIFATDYWDGQLLFKYWKPSRNLVLNCSIHI